MKIQTLQDCFETKVMALYDIETQIVKALPKLIKNVENADLKQGLIDHLAETEVHVERLESIFEMLEISPKKLKVEAIRGLVDDAGWALEQDTTGAALDTMIIASARYVEHYEIAGYTSLLEWSKILELDDAQVLIQQTLDEEAHADSVLAQVAQEINEEANVGNGPEAEEEEEEEEVEEDA